MSELMEKQKITGKFLAENVNRFLSTIPEYDAIKNYWPDFLNIASNFSKLEVCNAIKVYLTYRQLGEICYVPENDEDAIKFFEKVSY